MWWTLTIHVLVSTFGHSSHCLLVVVGGAKSLLDDDDDDNDFWQASSSILSCTIIITIIALGEMFDHGIHHHNGIVDHRFYDS